MRSAGGFGDVPTGAETFIEQAANAQVRDGLGVKLGTFGLPDDFAVPDKPNGREVGQLEGFGAGAGPVKILDPHQERAVG
jgi:hypothetical protein